MKQVPEYSFVTSIISQMMCRMWECSYEKYSSKKLQQSIANRIQSPQICDKMKLDCTSNAGDSDEKVQQAYLTMPKRLLSRPLQKMMFNSLLYSLQIFEQFP